MKSVEEGIEKEPHRFLDYSVKQLNVLFKKLDYGKRLHKIYEIYNSEDILITTSFGTRSIFLLDLIHKLNPNQKIYFVNTGYHFEETIEYKNWINQNYSFEIIELHPNQKQHQLTQEEAWWKDHPRMCCTINKIAPLKPVVAKHKIWISGLMSDQTKLRSYLEVFEQKGDILKFYPLIDLEKENFEILFNQKEFKSHPLINEGYDSIGCTHCTIAGEGRSGRWSSTGKTECGLHLSFFYKKP